jgi:hypothetical protein
MSYSPGVTHPGVNECSGNASLIHRREIHVVAMMSLCLLAFVYKLDYKRVFSAFETRRNSMGGDDLGETYHTSGDK